MSRFNKDQGDKGELLAILYLKKHGYRIIERNFRTRNGEIDIIAIDNSQAEHPILCFIEVKTRNTTSFGSPLEAIGYAKLRAMRRTALAYKNIHTKLPELLRLDAVSVFFKDITTPEIVLIKDIG